MLQQFTPVFGITLIMILLQPDLSSTFIIGTIIISMLLIGNVSKKYIGILILVAMVGFSVKIATSPYQLKRLNVWLSSTEKNY